MRPWVLFLVLTKEKKMTKRKKRKEKKIRLWLGALESKNLRSGASFKS
jgi:hypothetical protein